MLAEAAKMGYRGLSITEHETLSSAVSMLNEAKKMKEEGTLRKDFKVLLGDESYVVESLEEVRDNYQPGVTKFPHQILVAKNRTGFIGLSKISSQAWSNSFFTGSMERTPTTKAFLKEVVTSEEYKGTIFATSTCLGSSTNIALQEYKKTGEKKHLDKAYSETQWYADVFGKDDYFIELQPADTEVQRFVNKELVKIADDFGLKCIVACDTHFLEEDRDIHRAFLTSKEGEREVDEFYYYAHMHSPEQMYKHMAHYLGEEKVTEALENTKLLYDMCEDYDLDHSPIIPKIKIPEFEVKHIFEPAYDKYEFIRELAESDVKDNQYMLHLIEEGFLKELNSEDLSQNYFHEILNRINLELREILGISKKLNDTMSSYYLSCREIVNIMWDDSPCGGDTIVGSGRGSGAGFLINYLLGITQINPLLYPNMLHERHLSEKRPELPENIGHQM